MVISNKVVYLAVNQVMPAHASLRPSVFHQAMSITFFSVVARGPFSSLHSKEIVD